MSDVLGIALAGMRSATAQFSSAASAIVSAPIAASGTMPDPRPQDDMPAQFVGMMQARAAFGADIAVAKTAASMTRRLLDILV